MVKKRICSDCTFAHKIKGEKNEKGQIISGGLSNCSHLERAVISSDECCDNFKEKVKKETK